MSSNPIEQLLHDLRTGDSTAGRQFHQKYAKKIRKIATNKLNGRLRSKVSPDDIIQSVFRSFFRQNQTSNFVFSDWNALWALLVTLTVRKCAQYHRKFSAMKRDVAIELTYSPEDLPSSAIGSPTPDDIASIQDTLEWSLRGLNDLQQQIVLLRLANFSTLEISQLVDRTQRTVRRILEAYRDRLKAQTDP